MATPSTENDAMVAPFGGSTPSPSLFESDIKALAKHDVKEPSASSESTNTATATPTRTSKGPTPFPWKTVAAVVVIGVALSVLVPLALGTAGVAFAVPAFVKRGIEKARTVVGRLEGPTKKKVEEVVEAVPPPQQLLPATVEGALSSVTKTSGAVGRRIASLFTDGEARADLTKQMARLRDDARDELMQILHEL